MIIRINKQKYLYEKPKLKKWLDLQVIEGNLQDATGKGNIDDVIANLFSYLSVALSISPNNFNELAWYEIAIAFQNIHEINSPNQKFKVLQGKISDPVAFDYDNRAWYVWINLLASRYGWNMEYISELDFDDAVGLLQEILYDEQLNKEWDWVRSENAYTYNENTKKSEFKPLERPEWMQQIKEIKEPPVTKIKASMLPIGNVIKYAPNEN